LKRKHIHIPKFNKEMLTNPIKSTTLAEFKLQTIDRETPIDKIGV